VVPVDDALQEMEYRFLSGEEGEWVNYTGVHGMRFNRA
jgi:hypothetical protein